MPDGVSPFSIIQLSPGLNPREHSPLVIDFTVTLTLCLSATGHLHFYGYYQEQLEKFKGVFSAPPVREGYEVSVQA